MTAAATPPSSAPASSLVTLLNERRIRYQPAKPIRPMPIALATATHLRISARVAIAFAILLPLAFAGVFLLLERFSK